VTTRPGNLLGIQLSASSTEPSVDPLSHKQTSKSRKVCASSEASASGKYGMAFRIGIMTVTRLILIAKYKSYLTPEGSDYEQSEKLSLLE
jgi:hypothetical protein